MSDDPPRTGDRPPGYPAELERRIRLRDGREVAVRPILPSDALALASAIHAADPETLRRRFLGAPPKLTPARLAHLTTVDYRRRLALVALDPETGQGVAIARYEGLDDTAAEPSVAVDPAWRRAGLATALIEMLAHAALERGYHTFSALYLAENRPIASLVAHGVGRTRIQEGIAEAGVSLDRPPAR